MDAVNTAARSVEGSLGVSANVAQVVTWLLIFVVGYIALQLLQGALGGAKKARKRGQAVLLLGQCGAGKTALFFRLRDAVEVQSVSSLKPIRDTLTIKVSEEGEETLGPVEVIDYPGHQRLRGKSAELLKEARCIVYVIDAEDKQRLKDVAEHLYELLTHQEVLELHLPILLTINKSDLTTARTDKFIIEEIEREMEQMRVSRGATLEGQDQADSYLGIEGEKFKLFEHAPCPIETCRVSTKKPNLQPLFDLLRQHFA